MTVPITYISVDLLLILRILLAFGWGFAWAAILQFTRHGQFLAMERTWLTVVIGVGVDLLIAYPADWYTIALVISFSSVGIIVRSLLNESKRDETNWHGYKVKHGLEDAAALIGEIITRLEKILQTNSLPPADVAAISQALGRAGRLKETILAARRGDTLTK